MNRNKFGSWGIELKDDDFAQIIAVFGVTRFTYSGGLLSILKSEISNYAQQIEDVINLEWSSGALYNNAIDVQKNQNFNSPQAIVNAWREFVEECRQRGKPIRIEMAYWFYEREFDLLWVIEQLSRQAVGGDSVYVPLPESLSKPVWDYPLRIGLLNDAQSAQMRAELEVLRFGAQPLLGTHIKLIDVTRSGQDCDLLVLPHSLRNSVAALLQSPNALQAGCVLVLGKVEDGIERMMPLIEALKTQARAEGIGLVQVLPEKVEGSQLNRRQIWFKELIREFSHDQPIDIALFRACRHTRVNINTPLLFATRHLVETSRITQRILQYKERLAQPNWKGHEISVPNEGEKIITHNTGWKDSYTVGDVVEGLTREAENFSFDEEKKTATAFSELKEAVESGLETAPPPKPKPRWIQTEVWELGDAEKTFENRHDAAAQGFLRNGNLYQATVYIGEPSAHSLSPVEHFPEEKLPPNINNHKITVVFTESQLSPEPQTAKIILPREGNSETCDFYFRVPENITQIRARIITAYKNRVLQTVLLESAVIPRGSKEIPEQRMEVLTESVICPGFENLTKRRWFDAALVVNHGVADKPEMTKLVNDRAELIGIAGIESIIKWFRDEITNVAHNWEKFEKLNSKKSVDLLRNCAINGASLYDAMITGRDEGAFVNAERIQLITAKLGDDFPLEFVYERIAPNVDAPLCPHSGKALIDGHCNIDCPVGTAANEVVCPLGFWGLNRVIERHAWDARALQELGRADFALQSEPTEGREHLNIFDGVIVAASNNVDPKNVGTLNTVLEEIKNVAGIDTQPVRSWTDWTAGIKSGSPSLIVLLPHTFEDAGTKQQWMEIDAAERLLMQQLNREHLAASEASKPLVILMGCKTANPEIPYQSLIIKFKSKGAALVLGTGSTVFGPHAATVTKKLINALSAVKSEDVAFGDILLKVRRQLLAEGLMIVMCLTSYGDSDWLVSGVKKRKNV